MVNEKTSKMATDAAANSGLMRTIMHSEDVISNLMNECTDMVMNVQVANDMREINRRDEECTLSKSRNQFIERQAKKTQERIDFINSKWESIAKLKDSVDTYNAYETQKNLYLELIRQKDDHIRELQKELEEADEKYIYNQNLHREDINILTRRINEHIDIMWKAYRKHLMLIENTAIEEHKSLLYSKHAEWENKNNIFEQEKVDEMNEIFKAVETFEKETIDIIWDHREKHRSMKKDLETQLQDLQIRLREMKTYCMLEERKLEYNYLVLTKRQEEMGPIKARQKRRINRLHNELTNVENEHKEMEEIHRVNCARLETDISKLLADKDALIQKMKRTDEVNENIFHQSWRLNEKRIRKTLHTIIKMDQEINEQVLCLKWTLPTLKFKTVSQLPSLQFYTERVSNFQQADSDLDKEPTSIFAGRNYPQLSPDFALLKFILNNVIDCMRFVMKDKIDCLTEDLDEEKKTLVKFDNILKVLDVGNESELELLKKYFLPYIKCSTCVARNKMALPLIIHSKRGQSRRIRYRTGSESVHRKRSTTITKRPSSTPSNINRVEENISGTSVFCSNSEHKWAIDQCMVVKVLANFLQDKKQRERRKNYSKFTKIPLARVLTPSDIELYWKSFKPKYVEKLENLWDILYGPLNDYLQLLKDGNTIKSEIKILETQNSELRQALSSFLKKDCKLEES